MRLNGALHEYAKALAPSSQQEQNYNEVVRQLGEILHRHSGLRFQLRPAGSFAKKSGLAGRMDLDVVVLINDKTPPFEDVLSTFEDILLLNSNLNQDDITRSPYSLQFTWPCRGEEVDVDLVMAANLVTRPTSDVSSEQHRLVLLKIENYTNKRGELDPFEGRRYYSGSFAEPTIEFIQAQSASVHELIRLVKLWKNSIFFSRNVFGLSSTMEILACYVGMEMEKRYGMGFSMVDAVETFFQLMRNLKNANIVFSHEAMHGYPRGKSFYSGSSIPQSVLNQRPLLLDPADPYNNRLHGGQFDVGFFNLLSAKADISLALLKGARNCHPESFGNSTEFFSFVVKILFPGPFHLGSHPNLGNFELIPPPANVAIVARTNERPPTPVVRRKNDRGQSRDDGTKKKYTDFCLKMYDMVMKSKKAFSDKTGVKTKSAMEITCEVVEHTMNKKLTYGIPVDENAFDYSLIIPSEEGDALKILFKW